MNKRKQLLLTSSLATASLAFSTGAMAQTRDDDQIIVTATRRSQSVQDIPSNISAVTGDQLERAGISDITGLTRLVPGLSMFDEGPRASGNRNAFNIRGLNVNNAWNNDDEVPLTQDTVTTYLGESPIFFPFKLVDLERVEVLRGPQGTLYGSGSVGGTVRFIPKKPDTSGRYFEASGEVSTTKQSGELSYDAYFIANFPISDQAALRVSAGYEHYGGFIDALGLLEHSGTPRDPGTLALADPANILTSDVVRRDPLFDHNDADVYFARASLLFEPTDILSLTLNYTFQRNENEGRYEDNPLFGTKEEYVNYKAFTDPQESEVHLINMDAEIDLGFATLTSATSYAKVDTDATSESSGFVRTNLNPYYFGFPRIYAPIKRFNKVETLTQEVRLVSATEGPLDWIIGAFYLRRDVFRDLRQVSSGLNDYTNAYFGFPQPVDFGDVIAVGTLDTSFDDIALFGELTYRFTDRLAATGGFRLFKQTLDGSNGTPLVYSSRVIGFTTTGDATDDFLLGGYLPLKSEVSDSIFKTSLAYDLNDDTLVYATWAQGFRSGGANSLPLTDPLGNDNSVFLRFDPDKVNNYEIGIKGTLLDTINYTLTGFWVDWEDFQTSLFTPLGIAFIDNIPSARSRGFETEITGRIGDQFNYFIGYTFVDAETTSSFELQANVPSSLIQEGLTLPGSAKHNLSAGFDYYFSLDGGNSELVLHGDLAYRSKANTQFRDIPAIKTENFVALDSFEVLNTSLTWQRENLRVAFFIDNLTNSRGTTTATSEDFFGPADQSRGVIRPRTMGVRISWSTN